MENILLTEIARSVPKLFVTESMRAIEWAYEEAFGAAHNDPLLGDVERDYLYPHYRRSIIEKKLRDVGAAIGLDSRTESNIAGNFQFTTITAGRIVLTCSHKGGQDWRMLRSSIFREQHASLNLLLSQMEFGGGGFEVFQAKDTGGLLNAVIYHGTDLKDKSKVGYLRLGFPSVDNSHWAARFDFYEILSAYRASAAPTEDDDLIIKWKSKSREMEG